MTIINNSDRCSMEILAPGVVLFSNAFSLDVPSTVALIEPYIASEFAAQYKEAFNEQTGQIEYVNRSGYFFKENDIMKMPRRFTNSHTIDDEKLSALLSGLEEAKDDCLVRYIMEYPLAYKTIWWKIKGHFVSYSTSRGGLYLGPHSDNSVDYEYGFSHPSQQIATRGTVSCVSYINSANDPGLGFTGGTHKFTYLDVEYSPASGDVLMFPSNFVAAHEVTEVLSGSRYSYLGWYSHGTPNPSVGEMVVDPIDPGAKSHTNVYVPHIKQKLVERIIQDGTHNHAFLASLVGLR